MQEEFDGRGLSESLGRSEIPHTHTMIAAVRRGLEPDVVLISPYANCATWISIPAVQIAKATRLDDYLTAEGTRFPMFRLVLAIRTGDHQDPFTFQLGDDHLIRSEHLKSTHLKTSLLLFAFGSALFVGGWYGLGVSGISTSYAQCWSLYCIAFLIGWWIVYFNSNRLNIWNLRRFLVDKSRFRGEHLHVGNEMQEFDHMKFKATSTMQTTGALIAVTSIFLAFILQDKSTHEFWVFLRSISVATAVVTLIFMVFAIDILDTVSNLFREKAYVDSNTSVGYSKFFYRRVGSYFPQGGISFAYLGYAMFSIFVVMSLSYINPLYAGLGTAFYAYLGYPYWFGYRGVTANGRDRVEPDERFLLPPVILLFLFLVVTVIVWQVDAAMVGASESGWI